MAVLSLLSLPLACGGATTREGETTGGRSSGGAALASGGASATVGGISVTSAGDVGSGGDVGGAGAAGAAGATSAAGGAGGAAATACAPVTGDFGDCEVFIGWGFDGSVCRPWSGCGCADDCASLFPTAADCAATCAAAGRCNAEALVGAGIAATFAEGDYCDDVLVCASSDLEPDLATLLPLSGACRDNSLCWPLGCPTSLEGTIEGDTWRAVCAATLLPDVQVDCFVLGP